MEAKLSVYGGFTRYFDVDNNISYKAMNDFPVETTGLIDEHTNRFPIVTTNLLYQKSGTSIAIDVGYNVRLICDDEFLDALALAIHRRKPYEAK